MYESTQVIGLDVGGVSQTEGICWNVLYNGLEKGRCGLGDRGIVVIKYGGSAIDASLADVVKDIVAIQQAGWDPVLVHGGGKDINRMLERLQIPSEFQNGLRVTDSDTMEVVEMVLRGSVNLQIVAELQKQGAAAIGVSGVDHGLLKASQKDCQLGFVGDVTGTQPALLRWAINQGLIPVVAPIGLGSDGVRYNINADEAAGAIAGALEAEHCLFLTDVEGVMIPSLFPNQKQLLSKITCSEIGKRIEQGDIYGGMIPKLQACLYALQQGAKGVQIVDGRRPRTIRQVLIDGLESGTKVVWEEAV